MARGSGGDVAKGVAGGATTGAAFGPYGMIAGGVIGGGLGYLYGGKDKPKYEYDPNQANFGLPGYDGMNSQYGSMLGQGPRSAPQAGQSSFRGGQGQLAQMLMAQSRGRGPGQEIARMQAETQVDRGLGQQLAGARSARPGQSAMAARNAAMASGQLQGAGAQAATMGGLQAQQSAIGSLGNVLGQARGQDQSLAMGNANLRYQTMGLDDSRQMEVLRQRLAMNQAQQSGNISYEGARAGKAGVEFNYAASQPSSMEQYMGAAQGMGQAYMQSRAGSQPSSSNSSGGGGYWNQSDANKSYGGGSY